MPAHECGVHSDPAATQAVSQVAPLNAVWVLVNLMA
jgi:hypothetical protein